MPPRVVPLEEIQRSLDVVRLLEEIAAGFVAYSAGDVITPPVGHLGFLNPRGDVHIKYGHIRGDTTYVIKIASGFEENIARGLPPGNGMMLVFDRDTGIPLALLLDRGWLTDIRTAAAGAVVARALAPSVVRRIGIVGSGVQARLQLELLAPATPCRDVIVWSRTREHAEQYAREMEGKGFCVAVAATADELAGACDLIVTTTTARNPLFSAGAVHPGTHISAFGADAPGKQELDVDLFRRADVVVVDSRAQTADHGDLAHALAAKTIEMSAVRELGDVLSGRAPGRTSDRQITVCDLTGVAVQDIVIAKHVLSNL